MSWACLHVCKFGVLTTEPRVGVLCLSLCVRVSALAMCMCTYVCVSVRACVYARVCVSFACCRGGKHNLGQASRENSEQKNSPKQVKESKFRLDLRYFSFSSVQSSSVENPKTACQNHATIGKPYIEDSSIFSKPENCLENALIYHQSRENHYVAKNETPNSDRICSKHSLHIPRE